MTYQCSALPDPETQADFYADVNTKRFLAFFMDCAITLALAVIIVPFTAFIGLFFFPFLWAFVDFIYRVVTLNGKSATWGMRFFAVEFRTEQGERFDFVTAFLHTTGFYLSTGTAIVQMTSIVLMLLSPRCQGLTDRILGTVLLNRRSLR